ncbi:type II toxin-antitoxin system toxin DNA ADP-ribosyl transferase DarT [Planomonospora algeriensis]
MLHFTHIGNLRGIVGPGLTADNRRPGLSVECGEPGIKQRRREQAVPVGPGGVVADYVPFYFAARSPMLYRIHKGGVSGYQRGQSELVYLVTRLSRIITAGLAWVATDRNAALEARFAQQVQDLRHHIDWEVMKAENWANTEDDGSRKQRRMAELLVHGTVPWTAISHVYAYDDSTVASVSDLLAGHAHRPHLAVRPWWYF